MRPSLRLLALAAVAATAVMAPPSNAAGGLIQPGVYSETAVGGCTLNFVYDGVRGTATGGRTYVGTAAHCVEAVGDDVALGSGEVFGDVAFTASPDTAAQDFAFIEVRPEFVSRVSPAVKGHANFPTGVSDPNETTRGDEVQLSGFGMGYDLTPTTQEKRVAILGNDNADVYDVAGPIHWGDSGGPLVHTASGGALGIVSRLCFGTCTEIGPTVQGMLDKAAEAGFHVTLRTV